MRLGFLKVIVALILNGYFRNSKVNAILNARKLSRLGYLSFLLLLDSGKRVRISSL